MWVIVNDKFEIYLYKEGYIRTSSEIYTTEK